MRPITNTMLKVALVAVTLALSAGPTRAFDPTQVPGVSGGNVNMVIKGNVATIFGTVESRFDRKLIERFVKKNYGVDQVINLITTSE